MGFVDIRTTYRGPTPRLPYREIAEAILGQQYELSLVISGDRLARRMNKAYRKKNYRPNVLSFPLSRKEGEIFLNAACATREATRYQTTLKKRLALLYVHGCCHLKGLDHGRTMESLEQAILKRFKFEN